MARAEKSTASRSRHAGDPCTSLLTKGRNPSLRSKLLRTRLSDLNHVHAAHHGAVARPGSHIAGGTVKGARVQDTDARLDLTVTRPQALRIMKEYKELRSDALAGLGLRRKLCEGVVSNNFFF